MKDMFAQGGSGSAGIKTNKQAIARYFGVKQSEVVYFSPGAPLTGYKVIYDKESQRAYSLPVLPVGTTAVSLSELGILVHSTGSVDLGELAVTRGEFIKLSDTFASGATINAKNEVLSDGINLYRWAGVLPKVVVTNATPETSGGIADDAWVGVGATPLNTLVLPYVEAVNPQSDEAGILASFGTTRESTLLESITVTNPIILPSYFKLSGIGFAAYRADRTNFKTVSKSGNATYNFVNEDATAVTVDTVIGIDPAWVDGRWPQQVEISNLAVIGDRSSVNEAGIYIRQGSGYKIRDCTFAGCKNGLRLGDVWVSEFTNLQTLDGAFQSSRGTSQRWNGCWSAGNANVIGAYHFEDTTYTTLTSCASDHAPRTAFFFQNGCEVTMVSCGTEFPTNSTDTALGTMIALNGSNRITCIGFKGVPNANQTQPLISVGDNDFLHIINWNSYQVSYPNSIDISVNGDGSTIIIEDGEFSGTASGNTAFPRVQFRGDYPSSRVILRYKHKEYIYKCPTGGGFVTSPEESRSTATYTPTVLVNNAVNPGLSVSSATARYTKNGNQVHLSWDITISSLTGISGASSIKLQIPTAYPSGAASTGTQLVTGATSFTPGACYQDGVNQYVYLYSSSAEELAASNLTSGTRLRGSITYLLKNTAWV